MSKVIESPISKFSGSVTLYDPLNMAQTLGWEKAVSESKKLRNVIKAGGEVMLTDFNAVYLPAIIACVEAWNLIGIPSGPTLESFPFSPRLATAKLMDWIIGEITKIYVGEEADGEKNA
jgi:hypothetical protein